jgi:hypothetical protein
MPAAAAAAAARGACEVFTSLRHFKDDLVAHPPDHFVCVPLVLDTLYTKVCVGVYSNFSAKFG